MSNKKLEDTEYTEKPRDLVVEKLTMAEMLNAEDFNILLQILQEEFNRTFVISIKNEEKEIILRKNTDFEK